METYLIIAVVILSVICVILFGKIIVMKKSTKEIKDCMERIIGKDTNEQITISSSDNQICSLASAINRQLCILRKERLNYENGDRELKKAITNISHDLRTPLTAILGYTQMAKNEDDEKKVKEYLSIIDGRATKMKELTNELFTYSLMTAPDKELILNETDIRSVLEDSIAENYVLLTDNNIIPQIDISANPVIKSVDSDALQRVFSNIISNAAKYSDGDLKITLAENGIITFSNTAENLSNIEVGRLFDRFFTVENGQKSTGLGLSIAKCLTEKMGGRIFAEYKERKLVIQLIF